MKTKYNIKETKVKPIQIKALGWRWRSKNYPLVLVYNQNGKIMIVWV